MRSSVKDDVDISVEVSRILTVREVSRILKINEAAVRRLIRDGELVASRVGRLWRVRLSEIERFLDAKEPP